MYKTIVLPVALYGYETLSVILREEHRLRLFQNKVLRKIFGPKRDEVNGDWRKLHNGELHNLYTSPDKIRQIKSRRMRWAGYVARMGEGRNVNTVLVGKPEGKRPLVRPRRRWGNGTKMERREIGWGGVEWIHLDQDGDRWRAVVNAVMKLGFYCHGMSYVPYPCKTTGTIMTTCTMQDRILLVILETCLAL
jgi:hypothetical protein